MYVRSVPYWTLQRPKPVNPDRNVQLIVALFGELISSTSTTRSLLVVPMYRRKGIVMNHEWLYMLHFFTGKLFT